jgi:hypothetical protein
MSRVIGNEERAPKPFRKCERGSQTAKAPTSGSWAPSFSPWLIAAAVMSATFMEVLDTSVANVSLPHSAGSLSGF